MSHCKMMLMLVEISGLVTSASGGSEFCYKSILFIFTSSGFQLFLVKFHNELNNSLVVVVICGEFADIENV